MFQVRYSLSSRVSNRYSDDSVIGRSFYCMYRLLEVGGAFDRYYRPLQFEFQVWCSSFTCFRRYSLLNVVSERSNDQTFDIYFQTAFPVSSVKQLLIRFLQHWEAPRLCCCTLTSHNRTCLKH